MVAHDVPPNNIHLTFKFLMKVKDNSDINYEVSFKMSFPPFYVGKRCSLFREFFAQYKTKLLLGL